MTPEPMCVCGGGGDNKNNNPDIEISSATGGVTKY